MNVIDSHKRMRAENRYTLFLISLLWKSGDAACRTASQRYFVSFGGPLLMPSLRSASG
jgi:hypothetical protein